MAKLAQILQTANNAEGRIKCTYAEIYDLQGHKLFSLQRKNFVGTDKSGLPVVRLAGAYKDKQRFVEIRLLDKAKEYIKNHILAPQPYYEVWVDYDEYTFGDWYRPTKKTELIYREHAKPSDAFMKAQYDSRTTYNAIIRNSALIQQLNSMADQYVGFKDMPEAMVNSERFKHSLWAFGVFVMLNSLKPYVYPLPSMTYYLFPEHIYVSQFGVKEFADRFRVSEQDALEWLISHPTFSAMANNPMFGKAFPKVLLDIHVNEAKKVAGYADGYEEVAQALNDNDTFLVKECAIDWYGTDVKNGTIVGEDGQEYDLDDYIALYKKKMDNAKALLIAAGAAAALI